MNPAEQLCLACGLCCDGTLFDNVRLGPGDDAKRLKALGLPVTTTRTRPPVTLLRQPCAALCADRTCRAYADRPGQCRAFECGVFQDATAGRMTYAAARRQVTAARKQADAICRLLCELGDTDETRSLTERFKRTQERLESGGADATAAEQFAELSQAVHRFGLLAYEKFYTRAAGS